MQDMFATMIPVNKIKPNPRQPRQTMDPFAQSDLVASVREKGVLSPICVTKDDDGYVLVHGERRWRAAQAAGLTEIPAVVRDEVDELEALLLAVIENVQREDMKPVEEAAAYQAMRDEFGLTVHEIARRTGKSRAHIDNLLKMNRLEDEIKEHISNGDLSRDPRLVSALLAISEPSRRCLLARQLVDKKVPLKTAIEKARKLADKLGAERIPVNRSVATTLAKRHLDLDEPEDEEPPRWNILRQMGRVPSWSDLVKAAEHTCEVCSLKDIATVETCGDCPAVTLLAGMMEAAYADKLDH